MATTDGSIENVTQLEAVAAKGAADEEEERGKFGRRAREEEKEVGDDCVNGIPPLFVIFESNSLPSPPPPPPPPPPLSSIFIPLCTRTATLPPGATNRAWVSPLLIDKGDIG